MEKLIGTEEVIVDTVGSDAIASIEAMEAAENGVAPAVVLPEAAPVVLVLGKMADFNGLALKIQAEIERLIAARDATVKLESGLITKADLNRAAKSAREGINVARKTLSGLYPEVLDVKRALIDNLDETQKEAELEKLKKQKIELEAKLAALGVTEEE